MQKPFVVGGDIEVARLAPELDVGEEAQGGNDMGRQCFVIQRRQNEIADQKNDRA
ncbi:hypothetical protein SDC9_147263 [bioreactor metagenome]|uniref:Uncharacterized protein n=1 Tax=bioreactor metagenome TaxID=1076179 RepID=A0A645EG24_9ZZZZ